MLLHFCDEVFSRKSDSTIANVLRGCGYIKSRVWLYWKWCGYMSEIKTPLTSDISSLLTIEPIDHQTYWPSSLSTIKPIDHWAYWPLSLSTIKPIDHLADWPLSPSTIMPINHQAYWPSSLSNIKPIDYRAHWPLSPLTIEPIDLWSSFATFKPFGLFYEVFIEIY